MTMIIDTYLENHDACKKKNALLETSRTRVLTDKEREKLDSLITATNQFQDKIINFD